jgi:S-adenosylmethionine hydrolase
VKRIIALVTDFGLEEHYAGAMKGAILSVNPEATIIDISHGIQAHSVLEGALVLAASYRFFPPRTIHVAVVDPGVGGQRRGLIVVGESYFFVGPDNGILSLVMEEMDSFTCYEIQASHYYRPEVSPVFHGRDIFGPVAGWLSRGIAHTHFGGGVTDPIRLPFPRAVTVGKQVEGEVIHIDRFGSHITTIRRRDLEQALSGSKARAFVEGQADAPIPVKGYYGEVPQGEPCALIGSSGFLEIAVNRGRATDRFQCGVGAKVVVTAA